MKPYKTMKTNSIIICTYVFICIVTGTSCNHDEPEPKPKDSAISIMLYNKPLDTIQHYTKGKWKLVYAKGGICGTCLHFCDNCYVEFTSNNKFISNTFAITNDTTTIHWVRDIGTWINNDSTYLMTIRDKDDVPWVYVIDQIYNDTLIYHDNSDDAVFYHFIKLN